MIESEKLCMFKKYRNNESKNNKKDVSDKLKMKLKYQEDVTDKLKLTLRINCPASPASSKHFDAGKNWERR